MFLHVIAVETLAAYRLRLHFDDGCIRDVDLADELHGEVFEPLLRQELFDQVAVNRDTNTIEWPNGADFAPEFLHQLGTAVACGCCEAA